MYFKVSGRHNPQINRSDWYYRLVESYRNADDRVCHRIMLNYCISYKNGPGFTSDLSQKKGKYNESPTFGLLAYWVVNTVWFQFKELGINSGWREIVRTMNTQKAVTTLAQNHVEEVIRIRRSSEPNQNVKKLYHYPHNVQGT